MPERRRQRNDRLRAEVNARIAAVAEHLDEEGDDHVFQFLCECNRRECFAHVELSLREFHELGADRARLVVPEHYEGDRVHISAAGANVYAIDEPS